MTGAQAAPANDVVPSGEHGYDYAIPEGKGVFGKDGWLQPALTAASGKPELTRLVWSKTSG